MKKNTKPSFDECVRGIYFINIQTQNDEDRHIDPHDQRSKGILRSTINSEEVILIVYVISMSLLVLIYVM